MKKYIVLAAAAIATLASCTKNEVAAPQNNEISFKALTIKGKQTKAPINSNIFPTDLAFKVWANYKATADFNHDGAQYIPGYTSTYITAEDLWTTTTKAYWPLSGYLTFAAVAPATAVAADGDGWNSTLSSLKVSGFSAADQVDLMYVNPESIKNVAKGDSVTDHWFDPANNSSVTNKGVNLLFKHALSQVLVNVKALENQTGVSFKITSLSIKAKDNATITVTDAATPTVAATSFGTPMTKAFTVIDQKTNGTTAGLEFASATTTSFIDVTTGAAHTSADAGILVIPQALAAADADQVLTVAYEMYFNGVSAGNTSKTIDLYLAQNTNNSNAPFAAFEAGKKYILDLIFSAEEIKYAAHVADWVEETVGNYEVK